jgi:putative ABC transport system permease protein
MKLTETIGVALDSVKTNSLRTVLTLLIIAVGLMALVGILTALDSVLFSLNDSFNDMGANSFTLERKSQSIKGNRGGRRMRMGEPIDYEQAAEFKERYDFPAKVTISITATGNATVQRGDKKTNPIIAVYGVDENYLDVKGQELDIGRNFSETEIQSGANKAIIGIDLVKTLFNNNPEKAMGEDILIGNVRYLVIGILKSKGSGGGSQGGDRLVIVPLLNSKRVYDNKGSDYSINVGVASAADMDNASDVATGLFRQIRKLRLDQEEDFEVFKSDSLLDLLKENTVKIRWATIGIGLITLLGASIGLMNIMLVSVTERTREIGIRKALGATRSSVLAQFLTEAIVICQMGGIIGIFLGVLAGFGVSLLFKGAFVMPWAWIILGLVTCFVVGLFSGLYPALKASRLDPIESLRYE